MYGGLVDWPWWGYVVATLVMTHLTIASVTIFLHRHQAHRALDLHPLMAHLFRLWLWLSTGMVTREWAAVHRKHHARCETREDPHSPQIYGIHRVLWLGVFLYVREALNPETIERYGRGTPDDWIERHLYTPWHKLGIVIMLAIDVLVFGVVAGPTIWVVQIAWIPFWAAGVINGLGHYWGYRNFNSPDASTNLCPWGILIGGEELHNNHHSFATSARLSNRWYEFDIGWLYIRLLAGVGLARVKKVAPRPRVGQPRPVVDFDTVQAVIINRYDVLARYARSLRQMYRDEVGRLQDGKRFRGLKRWLAADAASVPQELRERLQGLLGESRALATAYAMRQELVAVWERSTASREQVLHALQDWCERAESSGVRQLQDLSRRLRSYVLA
ncbi:fatty acid desaturase [Accumulibacter sp.]|uniref:DesA family fatty acid desaturase n=1 Tax=Accumulibacter sp. TaxID=2053492 RepID=UPI0025EA24EF|nr:fatty acid desaturase [Accumulibacter sp.]MCM8595085.1 fatty acid desaturase [Accumulibacter sp.]MCM8625468.1 fatty acid desaturase [Accumulibacter sp.]MDS4049231.1 fatty acid desaturase [Accumulibacter sp.]